MATISDTPNNKDIPAKCEIICRIHLLTLIKAAQQQHGMRHGDYQRYHQYISRKLRRMRKSLRFQQGTRSKVVPKKMTAEMINDERYIILRVFEIERSWAYAMQLKAEANTDLRKRFQMLSRLRKAVLRANHLSELMNDLPLLLDPQTELELQAYIRWIRGILCFEMQDWIQAKEFLESTQTIYNGLIQTGDEDSRSVYANRVDEILPQIHYCAYNAGDKSAASNLQRMRATTDLGGLAGLEIDQLLSQARASEAGQVAEVNWLGMNIPVKFEKAKMAIIAVQDADRQLLELNSVGEKVALYESVLKSCVEAISAVRDELRSMSSGDPVIRSTKEQKKNSSTAPSDKLSRLHVVYNYLQFLKLTKTIERSLLHITDALSSSSSGSEAQCHVQNGLGTSSYPKPQELARLYDALVQNIQELLTLPGQVQECMGLKDLLQAKILAYKSYRCYYLAFTYFHAKRYAECSALLMRAKRHTEQALNALEPTTASWTITESEASPGPAPSDLMDRLHVMLTQIEAEDLTCRAAYMLDTSSVENQAADVAENLDDKLGQKVLVDRLDQFLDIKSVEKSLSTQTHPFVQLPPKFEPVPVKPMFFDLALNHVQFPSLTDTDATPKTSGIAGMVRGWLWGGASADTAPPT